ncbi:hypothetical protein CHS0354_028421 [Potamilus streckersoni]|uniref:Uncharacterized protein n=1 Tax=Potamilus streckersoni TaxID=2493646 RepID=A0AAE0VVB1_9BIVA|nr:hypothetical protein CHS0354_028421 [Potamilus streckersoni]
MLKLNVILLWYAEKDKLTCFSLTLGIFSFFSRKTIKGSLQPKGLLCVYIYFAVGIVAVFLPITPSKLHMPRSADTLSNSRSGSVQLSNKHLYLILVVNYDIYFPS